jgi:predicted nucleotidyltransferase
LKEPTVKQLKSEVLQPQLTELDEQVLEELKRKLSTLLEDKLVSLRLFGSKARGDAEPSSDLDVALIVEGLSREVRRQVFDLVAEVELKHLQPISILLISKADYMRLRERERRIASDIEREGIPL